MTSKIHGLTQAEAEKRLKEDGYNEVPEPKYNFWKEFASKLWNLSAWILEAALILEFVLGKQIQALFIVGMLLFAAWNGASKKKQSRKVLDSISHQLTPTVSVERDGKWSYIDSKNLVVGDLVSLKAGDVLSADMKLVSGNLAIDESSITGESKPVKKAEDSQLYSGTTIVTGSGLALVNAIGAKSRAGKTINLINKSAAPGHLQQLLTKIIFALCTIALTLTAIVLVVAIIRKDNILELLPFLAMMFIASIPVAMPSTFAVSNSVEAKYLSKQGILTSDLTGIQDAANLNLLLLDKTGTITENKTSVYSWTNFTNLNDDEVIQMASAAIDQRNSSIIDNALKDYLKQKKISYQEPDNFTPFTSAIGYSMATIANQNIKLGSFKQLSQIDPDANEEVKNIDFAAGRSVAVLIDDKLAGVFILKDKIRKDSKATLAKLKNRGIKCIMLTGDNQKTAANVAKEVGLTGKVISIHDFDENTHVKEIAGIADVLPEDKLRMVKLFQKKGFIVGMTGDGVNDAPALKQAEVGIAVSEAADVAKRSSKMVLMKDGLTPILHILDAGHRVYQRMSTWALTKISRTSELTIILTLGYILFRYLPIAFNAMVLYSILNSLVVITIATDNVQISNKPENWNILELTKTALTLTAGWVIIGIIFLIALTKAGFPQGQVSTLSFLYLVFTSLITVALTRTRKFFWQSAPSKTVVYVELADAVLSALLAILGVAMVQISWQSLLLVIAVSIVAAVLVDLPYHFYINHIAKN